MCLSVDSRIKLSHLFLRFKLNFNQQVQMRPFFSQFNIQFTILHHTIYAHGETGEGGHFGRILDKGNYFY
jgi:hypothetical protein